MIIDWFKGNNIDFKDLPNLFDQSRTVDVDFLEWYFEFSQSQSLSIENGVIKGAGYNSAQGLGVRAICEDKTGFSYSNCIDIPHIQKSANFAKKIAKYGRSGAALASHQSSKDIKKLYPSCNPISKLALSEVAAILRRVEKTLHSKTQNIAHYKCTLGASCKMMAVLASDDTLAHDVRPLLTLRLELVLAQGDKKESAFSAFGGRFDPAENPITDAQISALVTDAVDQAMINLEAKEAPAGTWPVALGSGWPGVLIHEAIGHGLEADFHYKKTSVYTDCMGQSIASDLCTIVDDGTLPGRRGSVSVDDEGTPGAYNVLIENGKLTGLMCDKRNAMLMGRPYTGNGRRESYMHLPMPRMTNTYMLPGKSTRDEIIASIDKGVYANNFSGGQVDIVSGQFVFSACQAYWVEKGKIQHPIKGVTLIGKGSDVLQNISMVGDDLQLDQGVGMCGKDGQTVPVGVGQPTLKIDKITVGGTKV